MNEKIVHQLIIESFVGPDGNLQVRCRGPVSDKILCYGLLGLAHDLIKEHKEAPLIERVNHLPPRLA